jgi:hypothetical protein
VKPQSRINASSERYLKGRHSFVLLGFHKI